VLYAGTGQPDARYDIMAGEGVYRSHDGGEAWARGGVERSRPIGALLVDPKDADHLPLGGVRHPFGGGAPRGGVAPRAGGPARGGAVDLAWDRLHADVIYAATWQMRLHPWLDYFMPQGGRGSGVWRSDDGGEHWRRLGGGLPQGRVGRIGLAVARGSGGRV